MLSLAYSPLCNYDFVFLRDDVDIRSAIEESNLYIIAQRPEMFFTQLRQSMDGTTIEFEIQQHQNRKSLKCSMPAYQSAFKTENAIGMQLAFEFMTKNDRTDEPPFNNLRCISLRELDSDGVPHFRIWFTPEKFLQNYWTGLIEAEVAGNIMDFTRYRVHYVGQSSKQEIWERLTGHKKLQDILSLEFPFRYGGLPTHEIVILAMNFIDNMEIRSLGQDSTFEDFLAAVTGKEFPDKNEIFLDAEKALIQAMKPRYNEKQFPNYPKSSDGLEHANYRSVTYSVNEPITLIYPNGEIVGSLNRLGGDMLIVQDGLLQVCKAESSS